MATRDNAPTSGSGTGSNSGFKPGRDMGSSGASDRADELRQNSMNIAAPDSAKNTPSMAAYDEYGNSTEASRGTTSSMTGENATRSGTTSNTISAGAVSDRSQAGSTWADVKEHTQQATKGSWGSSRYLQQSQQKLASVSAGSWALLAAAVGVGFFATYLYRRRNESPVRLRTDRYRSEGYHSDRYLQDRP